MEKKNQKKTAEERPVTEGYLNLRLQELKEGYFDIRFQEVKEDFDIRFQELNDGFDIRFQEVKREIKEEITEEMRGQTAIILQGVDKIVTRFDAAEKDHAAHAMLHQRITDDLHGHDQRIKKLEIRA